MTCQVCGCTDEHACEGGCFWVFKNVCSECVVKALMARGQEHGRAAAVQLINSLEVAIEVLGRALDFDEVLEPAGVAESPSPRLWRPGDPI